MNKISKENEIKNNEETLGRKKKSFDPRSRRWTICLNNPKEKGIDNDMIESYLHHFPSLQYYCLADEIGGEEKTYHTHIYFVCENAVRFSTLKNSKVFGEAHLEIARGNNHQNYDYVRKMGVYENTEKALTTIPETFREFGTLPSDLGQGFRSDIVHMLETVEDGASTAEIVKSFPQFALSSDKINKLRCELIADDMKERVRTELEVIYQQGKITYGQNDVIFNEVGCYGEICRITEYAPTSLFDDYQQQSVLVLDSFEGQIPITSLIQYLSVYPLSLPARYNSRTACYVKCYINSTIPLEKLYMAIQAKAPDYYEAFVSKIHKVRVYEDYMTYKEYEAEEYYKKALEEIKNK